MGAIQKVWDSVIPRSTALQPFLTTFKLKSCVSYLPSLILESFSCMLIPYLLQKLHFLLKLWLFSSRDPVLLTFWILIHVKWRETKVGGACYFSFGMEQTRFLKLESNRIFHNSAEKLCVHYHSLTKVGPIIYQCSGNRVHFKS